MLKISSDMDDETGFSMKLSALYLKMAFKRAETKEKRRFVFVGSHMNITCEGGICAITDARHRRFDTVSRSSRARRHRLFPLPLHRLLQVDYDRLQIDHRNNGHWGRIEPSTWAIFCLR